MEWSRESKICLFHHYWLLLSSKYYSMWIYALCETMVPKLEIFFRTCFLLALSCTYSTLLWTGRVTQKHPISSLHVHHKPFYIGYCFTKILSNFQIKLDVNPLFQIPFIHFPLAVENEHVQVPLLLCNNLLIWPAFSWKENAEVETYPDMFKYKCLLDSLPLRHATVIPWIKLSHLVYIKIISWN